jgi:hypothetical protein
MRVAVCGGKDFLAQNLISAVLNNLHREEYISEVLVGKCRGVDELVASWAIRTGIPVTYYESDWLSFGAEADDVRNQALVAEQPYVIVLFPGGKRTANLLQKAVDVKHQRILIVDPMQKQTVRWHEYATAPTGGA